MRSLRRHVAGTLIIFNMQRIEIRQLNLRLHYNDSERMR